MTTAAPDTRLPFTLDATSFRTYDKQLHRFLARRLTQRQDAEDLAQEVYLRLLRIDAAKSVQKPVAYIFGIASHVVADFKRGARPGYERLEDREDDSDERASSPDDLADRLNLQQQLERAFARLPRTHAMVLIAHKHCGLSYEEVAAELGLSVHTVEKYLTQAKAVIRTMTWER
jgi:RNA polymerase sigma-70 factor (ECF subfamily)